MHIVVFAEEDSNPNRISELLSKSEIESCDLFVSDWSLHNRITACLGAIRNNFEGDVYLITESIPVPGWAFDLDAKVSVIWKNQDPAHLAMCPGKLEIDLWTLKDFDILQNIGNISHFFIKDPCAKVTKPCKLKCDRILYGLKDDFFRLRLE